MNFRVFNLIIFNFLFISNLFGQNLSSQQFIETMAKEEKILRQKKASPKFYIYSKTFFIERPNYQPIIKYVVKKKGALSKKEKDSFLKLMSYGSFAANFYWKFSEDIINTKPGNKRLKLYNFFKWSYEQRSRSFPPNYKTMRDYGMEWHSMLNYVWLMETQKGLKWSSKFLASYPDFYYFSKYAGEPSPPKWILNYTSIMKVVSTNRGKKDQKFTIRRFVKAINNMKYIYKGLVYTGQGTSKDLHKKLKVGDFVTYGSFLSTSVDPSVAEHFRSKADSYHRLILKSKSGRYVAQLSTSPHEKEVLFNLFSVFKVTKIKKIGKFFKPKYEIRFEEVPGKKLDKNTKKMTTGNRYVQKFFP